MSIIAALNVGAMYSILLLEDDRISRELIRNYLGDEGIHVETVASLAELKRVLPTQCDLLLADLNLPDGNSLQVLPNWRDAGLLNVDFLEVTADNSDHALAEAFAAGARDYLSKPLILDELHVRITAQLQTKRYHQQLQGVLDALPSGVMLVDAALTVHQANLSSWSLFGHGKHLGQLPRKIVFQTWLAPHVSQVLSQRRPVFDRWQSQEDSQAIFDVSIQISPHDPSLAVIAIDDKSELLHARDNASIIGESRAVALLNQHIARVARLSWNTLIEGPSGSGKELVARQLHRLSDRAHGPFVALNCAAIHEGLLGDLLFGHERGAFTGAQSQYAGVFEQAEGGTLFLDEIADLPMAMQGSLLRVLQEKTVTRLGGRQAIKVNARVICATHKNLAARVQAGHFREDLFYRVNAVVVQVPPLRAREQDAALLLKRALMIYARELNEPVKTLTPAAERWATAQYWPGNVRQLEQVARRLVLHPAQQLDVDACDEVYRAHTTPDSAPPNGEASPPATEVSSEQLLAALAHCKGNKTATAKYLGVGRATLYRKLQQHGL